MTTKLVYKVVSDDGRYLDDMKQYNFSKENTISPHKIGEIIYLPLGLWEQNNRAELATFEVVGVSPLPRYGFSHVLTIRKKDERFNSDYWDGLDGWLQPPKI
jgi:hypothetical protein